MINIKSMGKILVGLNLFWPVYLFVKFVYRQQTVYIKIKEQYCFFFNSTMFLLLYDPVNRFSHVGTVSSPNHAIFPGQA